MEEQGSRVIKAIKFAFKGHTGTTRKCTDIPYIVHPLDVGLILMKSQASENLN